MDFKGLNYLEICEKLGVKDLRGVDLRSTNLKNADLINADLRNAKLEFADLRDANLTGVNLRGADLRVSNLEYADLRNTDLRNANLRGAVLTDVDLTGAILRNVNLRGANLRGVNLTDADLTDVDLTNANLEYANLTNIHISERTIGITSLVPKEGSFIGYKKLDDNMICKILILEDAKRSSATTLKCRCSKAKVLDIYNKDDNSIKYTQGTSEYDRSFIYTVGEIIEVKEFDENRWNECSTGIHFFMDEEMAKQY